MVLLPPNKTQLAAVQHPVLHGSTCQAAAIFSNKNTRDTFNHPASLSLLSHGTAVTPRH
jgi:hypothetical protein